MIRHLAENTPTGIPTLRLVDSTPVPCGASRETAKRSDLAGDAGYGYCASHTRYFWGMRLYLVTTIEGMPVTWCLANPELDERDVMAALLEVDHHLVQSGLQPERSQATTAGPTRARPAPMCEQTHMRWPAL